MSGGRICAHGVPTESDCVGCDEYGRGLAAGVAEERARVVAWLRGMQAAREWNDKRGSFYAIAADCIEREETAEASTARLTEDAIIAELEGATPPKGSTP